MHAESWPAFRPSRSRSPRGSNSYRAQPAKSACLYVIEKPFCYRRDSDSPAQIRRASLMHRTPTSGHYAEPPVRTGNPATSGWQPTLHDPAHSRSTVQDRTSEDEDMRHLAANVDCGAPPRWSCRPARGSDRRSSCWPHRPRAIGDRQSSLRILQSTPTVIGVVRNRGRDAHYWAPPAQIRTCGIPAYGSYLGCLTAKRWLGQG